MPTSLIRRPSRRPAALHLLVALAATAVLLVGLPSPASAQTGLVTGTVTDGAGAPIANLRVKAHDAASGLQVASALTTVTGGYSLALAPGNYRFSFSSGILPYPTTWYPSMPVSSLGSVITVTDGSQQVVDQAMLLGGTLNGVATNRGGPMAGLNVWLAQVPSGVVAYSTKTDTAGGWSLSRVVPGTYRLLVRSATGAVEPRWWPSAGSFEAATDVVVAPSSSTSGLDVELATTALVSGRVTDGVTGTPLPQVGAWLLLPDGAMARAVLTDSDGRFAFDLVEPGTYYLNFIDWSTNYPSAGYWPDGATRALATPITVSAGDVFVADKALYRPADEPMPPYSGTSGPKTVVIGDSITVQSTDQILAALLPDSTVSVKGIGSQRFVDMLPMAQKMAATAPDEVVIALGANDAGQGSSLAETDAALEQMLALFPPSSCITLLTPTAATAITEFNDAAIAIADLIRSKPSIHPNVQVADWSVLFDAHQTAGEPGGSWTVDGVHVTTLGAGRYAELMRAGVDACRSPLGSVAGSVHRDVDRDQLLGAGDQALDGILVALTGTDDLGHQVTRTAASAADGSWVVDGLEAGSYRVVEAPPADHALPSVVLGSVGGAVEPDGFRVDLPAGTDAFGYALLNEELVVNLSGRVFDDLDGNGAWSAGEPGRAGATVTLTGTDGNGLTIPAMTRTTGTDGTYEFPFVRSGTYELAEVSPYGNAPGGAIVGLAGGVADGQRVTGIVVGGSSTDAGGYDFIETPVHAADWVSAAGGPGMSLTRGVVTLADGSVVTAGSFLGSVTFGAGQPGAVTMSSRGGIDIFLARYDATGALTGAQQLGGAGNDDATKVALDPLSGDLVVTGSTDGGFRAGVGAAAGTTQPTGAGALVARFDGGGSLLWSQALPATGTATAASAAVAPDGDVVAVGWFKGVLSLPDGSTVTAADGAMGGIVARFAPDGTPRWVRTASAASVLLLADVAIDADGDAVVVGGAHAPDFGDGTALPVEGGVNVVVARYTSEGTVAHAQAFGLAGVEAALGVAIDPADGGIYLSGVIGSPTDATTDHVHGNGYHDAMVLALDAQGWPRWLRAFGGVYGDLATRPAVANGHVYVPAQTGGNGFVVDGLALPTAGSVNGIVASFSTGGAFEWVRMIGGSADSTAWGAAVLPDGGVAAVGSVAGVASVMPQGQALPVPGAPASRAYLARLVG